MTRHTDLAAQHHVVANHGAAGDAHLRGQQGISSDDDAVRDLHQVVDLGARLDARFPDGRAIDRRVGADLDVVLDHDRRDLRNLLVRAVVAMREAEAVAADDGAVLDHAACADTGRAHESKRARAARSRRRCVAPRRSPHAHGESSARRSARPLSMTTNGPIDTSSSMIASGAITADG